MEYITPQDLWPGLDHNHAINMWMMNWRPSREFSHALLSTTNINDEENDEEASCTFGVPFEELRECAMSMLAAADWLEQKREQWLKENNHGN